MNDIQGQTVGTDDIHTQYEGMVFECLDCGDLTHVRPGSMECHCGRQYDVAIEITATAKREKNNWPPE